MELPKKVDFTHVAVCNCGALTVTIDNQSYSMSVETFKKKYGFEIHNIIYSNCNHCVNHWGIDLCACGSGAPFEECDEAHEMCRTPMQDIEKKKSNPPCEWFT